MFFLRCLGKRTGIFHVIETMLEPDADLFALVWLDEASSILTRANTEKFVETMCRMRGAALKLGQVLSIQGIGGPRLTDVFNLGFL